MLDNYCYNECYVQLLRFLFLMMIFKNRNRPCALAHFTQVNYYILFMFFIVIL